MSTITEIVRQIIIILDAVPDIDQSSMDTYLPAVETHKVGLIMPPMGLRGTVDAPVGTSTRFVHRIPCEFWIRVEKGATLAACMTRGREICLIAARALQVDLEANKRAPTVKPILGDGEGNAFEWSVDDFITQVGNGYFIRANLLVTVTEWVVLQT